MTPEHDGRTTIRTEIENLAAARQGDEGAFAGLTTPHRRELHVHCYRMLGSLDDADDALQETFLRAWRQLDRFEPRAPFRAWLYRIATNVCLTLLSRRARNGEDRWTARDEAWVKEGDPVRLDPYPDHLLDELMASTPGPEAKVERDESVQLAFVASVQLLPPRQRATLLLRDVLDYSGAEAAEMLGTSVAGSNSALQRARAALERERIAGRITREHADGADASERALVQRLVDAWHAADVASIVALLSEDALLTMPPLPDRYAGPAAIGAFLRTVPAGGRLERFRLVPTRANRQPAVAVYLRDGNRGDFQAHGVIVLAISGDAIASLVRFTSPGLLERFGLPRTFADPSA